MKRMRGLFFFLALAFVLVPLFAPGAIALAQQTQHSASGLVPCGAVSAATPYGATECGLCDFASLIQNIINYLIILSLPLSAAIFAYAGFLLFTAGDNTEARGKAKTIFRNVAIGVIIALAGYLVIQTLLNTLVNPNVFGGNFSFSFGQCADDPAGNGARPRSSSISSLFTGLTGTGTLAPTTGTGTGAGGTGAGGTGQPQTFSAVGPNGSTQQLTFNATKSDIDLQTGFQDVQSNYGDQITAACQSQGSAIANCSQVVTALIAAESGGNPTVCSNQGACGLMQLLQSNGGAVCATSNNACTIDQINKGVAQLNATYTNPVTQGNLPNVLAAYNGGLSTTPGTSPSGLNPAMANSVDCPGQYAWQCSTNPGGLTQTQGYVASICRTLTLKGGSC